MAVSSNKSPSPRPIIPNPRTSENTNSLARRSFNGNPFSRPSNLSTHRGFNPVTPVNSPADSGKRVSTNLGKEGMGYEEKENELRASVKLRSPAKGGSKHFMSPTISASSKIASSPKKKILAERNDPVRTSISFSDGKATFFSTNSDENCEVNLEQHSKTVKSFEGNENLLEPNKETVVVTKPPKKVTFLEVPESVSDTVIMDSDICNDKPMVSPMIAPLDADPSLPPYDPITNYLSPRPQFRQYKPVPGIKALGDSFMTELLSDNYSDIEESESSQTDDSLKESEGSESSQTDDSLKESDDSSSAEMLPKSSDGSSSEEILHEAVVDQEEPKITESAIPVITPVVEEIAEAKTRKNPSSSTKSKFFSLLLVVMVAFVSFSVTDSPILTTTPGSIDLRFSNLSIPSDIPVFAKANSYFKQFSGEAISYVSKLIYDLGRLDDVPPFKFMNLTDLEEISVDHGYLKGSICSKKLDEDLEQVELEEDGEIETYEGSEKLDEDLEPVELEEDEETETDEEAVHMEADSDDDNEFEGANDLEIEEAAPDVHMEADSDDDNEFEGANDLEIEEAAPDVEEVQEADIDDGNEVELEGANQEFEEVSVIQLAEVKEADSLENDLVQEQYDLATEEVSVVVLAEGIESDSLERDLDQDLTASNVHLELAETKSSTADNDVVFESVNENPESLVKDDSAVEYAQRLKKLQSLIDRHEENNQEYRNLGISSVVLGLLAAAVVHILKRRSDKTLNPVVHADQVKKLETERVVKEKHYSQNWPTEVDVAGEFCPSEMSSFQISSSISRKYTNSVNDEAQSMEKKSRKINRRESLATSEYSMGTHSYGSFTTYEKIPIKHAGEEVITPVRRSSRIRSHVISP